MLTLYKVAYSVSNLMIANLFASKETAPTASTKSTATVSAAATQLFSSAARRCCQPKRLSAVLSTAVWAGGGATGQLPRLPGLAGQRGRGLRGAAPDEPIQTG